MGRCVCVYFWWSFLLRIVLWFCWHPFKFIPTFFRNLPQPILIMLLICIFKLGGFRLSVSCKQEHKQMSRIWTSLGNWEGRRYCDSNTADRKLLLELTQVLGENGLFLITRLFLRSWWVEHLFLALYKYLKPNESKFQQLTFRKKWFQKDHSTLKADNRCVSLTFWLGEGYETLKKEWKSKVVFLRTFRLKILLNKLELFYPFLSYTLPKKE